MSQSNKSRLPLLLLLGLLLGFVILSWFAYSNYSNSALSNLSPNKIGLDGTNVVRGGDIDDPFEQGLVALSDKKYKESATFFESVPSTSSSYSQARLYLAYVQYEQKEYTKTIVNAKIVINQSAKTANKQKAEWLQLQAMLASGDTKNADFDQLLDKIAATDKHLVQTEAGDLKQSMNSFWRGLVF